jgi:TonB-linked SusC/RagA family outer membrane protein
MGRKSYIGRINYSYKNKYLLEGILRADASAKFSEENRWGYFPSLSLGWRVSEEGFMQGISGLTDMKLRLSYGSSGNDNIGNFQYLAGFEVGNNYIIDGGVNQGIVSMGVPNENMTWEQIEIYNAGLDFTVLNRVLYGTVEAFYRNRSGILGTRATSLPSTFGADLPVENLNSINTRGFELTLGTANAESGDFKYDFSFNLSWSRSQWDHYEEPLYTDPDQLRLYAKSGTWTDRAIGYVAEGLFATQDEIDNLGYDMDLQGNISLKPGNIRFQDVNNDKKLDWKDQVEIGKGTVPHWMTGFNMILSYKNFSLNALFQGAFGYYTNISLPYSETAYKVRWTPETSSRDGKWSRGGGKDDLFSTYKYQKSGYLRLKTLNIGYDFSPSLLQKVNLEKLRLYVAGTNLFSIDGLKEWDIDPEAPTGFGGFYYPQMRTVTMGIIISL